MLFVLGSSLGCAVMINEKLYCGNTNQAGAMFMMPEYYDGDSYRYDEKANSIKLTKEYDFSLKSGNMLMLEKAALQNDEKAAALLEAYAKAVALKVWYSYLMYDPEVVVIGGGIANSDYIVGKIKDSLNALFQKDKSARKPLLVKTLFAEDSNLLGAYLLGINNE